MLNQKNRMRYLHCNRATLHARWNVNNSLFCVQQSMPSELMQMGQPCDLQSEHVVELTVVCTASNSTIRGTAHAGSSDVNADAIQPDINTSRFFQNKLTSRESQQNSTIRGTTHAGSSDVNAAAIQPNINTSRFFQNKLTSRESQQKVHLQSSNASSPLSPCRRGGREPRKKHTNKSNGCNTNIVHV